MRALQFSKILWLFNNVVKACFGQKLDEDNFREKNLSFEEQYRMLNILVMPKAHMVFSHISDSLGQVKIYVLTKKMKYNFKTSSKNIHMF